VARESTGSPTLPLSSEERRGLDEIVGLLLDVGNVTEVQNVVHLFGVQSRTVDIVTVRSSDTVSLCAPLNL